MIQKAEQYRDRIFIISLLTMVLVVALAFKKPSQKVQEERHYSNVDYRSAKPEAGKQIRL